MFRRLYLILLVSVLAFGAHAQSQLIFVHDTLSYTNVSIDSATQVLTVSDTVKNQGGPTFTGTVYVNGRINGGPAARFDSIIINGLDTAPASYILPSINIPIGQGAASFVSGPNGVVIWPIYQQQPFADSVYISIYVIRNWAGIAEAPMGSMYLIQTGGVLNVQFGDAQNIVKQVSFYDLSGRLMYSGSEEQAHHIATSGWSAGIYLCEIATWQGQRCTIKFVLQ